MAVISRMSLTADMSLTLWLVGIAEAVAARAKHDFREQAPAP